ncbi:TolB family protein [Colwellia piezophila]|uniref:TolB family protein n=1 Tax=Colwellia piezophila TaxID=211668 RepID=UPI00036C34C0|nr:PD40 domain-containing protein [Colwellia piezophila]
MKYLFLLITLLTSSYSCAEEKEENSLAILSPNTDIHLFQLAFKNDRYQLSNGINISNNPGYDNQPYFTPSSQSLLFVSARDSAETDVYEYDIKNTKTSQLTQTPHSEYSPKPIGKTGNISFVSEGFNPYQSVWQLDRKTGKQTWLLNSKEPVGYYQYNDTTGDVLFWSRYGWSVQYLNTKRNENRFVSGGAIPSTPHQIPNSNRFSFVHRQANGEIWIKAFDPSTFSITPIAPIFDSNYDYAWAPNGDILRFNNNQLQVWPTGNKELTWQQGQDLSLLVKGEIGRLIVSPDGQFIALVEKR